MVSFLFALIIALFLGFLAGMGVGGGSLLLLWLSQVVMFPQAQARIINLLFYLPAALISIVLHRKQSPLQAEGILPAAIAGCTAAIVFTVVTNHIDVSILKKLLGGLLVFIGLKEIFYRPRNAK